MTDRSRIKTIESAFELVEALQWLDGARASELAEHVEMPVSTVHDYLTTLEQIQYVTKQATSTDRERDFCGSTRQSGAVDRCTRSPSRNSRRSRARRANSRV